MTSKLRALDGSGDTGSVRSAEHRVERMVKQLERVWDFDISEEDLKMQTDIYKYIQEDEDGSDLHDKPAVCHW